MAIGNDLWYEPELFASGQRKDFSRGAYQEDATYFDTISAAWQLEPIGQFIRDEDDFMDEPYSPPQDVMEQV